MPFTISLSNKGPAKIAPCAIANKNPVHTNVNLCLRSKTLIKFLSFFPLKRFSSSHSFWKFSCRKEDSNSGKCAKSSNSKRRIWPTEMSLVTCAKKNLWNGEFLTDQSMIGIPMSTFLFFLLLSSLVMLVLFISFFFSSSSSPDGWGDADVIFIFFLSRRRRP